MGGEQAVTTKLKLGLLQLLVPLAGLPLKMPESQIKQTKLKTKHNLK